MIGLLRGNGVVSHTPFCEADMKKEQHQGLLPKCLWVLYVAVISTIFATNSALASWLDLPSNYEIQRFATRMVQWAMNNPLVALTIPLALYIIQRILFPKSSI